MDCPGHYSYRGAAEEDRLVMGNGYNEYRGIDTLQPCFKGTPEPQKGFDRQE